MADGSTIMRSVRYSIAHATANASFQRIRYLRAQQRIETFGFFYMNARQRLSNPDWCIAHCQFRMSAFTLESRHQIKNAKSDPLIRNYRFDSVRMLGALIKIIRHAKPIRKPMSFDSIDIWFSWKCIAFHVPQLGWLGRLGKKNRNY